MNLVHLIAWRSLLAAAVVATLIAAGPSAPSDHANATVETPADRPEPPRPHRRCRGPPTTQTSRTDRTPTPHATAQGHTPSPDPVPSAHDPIPRPPPIPPSGPRLHRSPAPTYWKLE